MNLSPYAISYCCARGIYIPTTDDRQHRDSRFKAPFMGDAAELIVHFGGMRYFEFIHGTACVKHDGTEQPHILKLMTMEL